MVNKIMIVGHLGHDPQVREMPNGKVRAEFSVATSYNFKKQEGEKVEEVDWHRVECWSGLAEIAKNYLKKGMQIYVEGRQRHSIYENSEGVQKTRSYINAHEIKILTPKGQNHE